MSVDEQRLYGHKGTQLRLADDVSAAFARPWARGPSRRAPRPRSPTFLGRCFGITVMLDVRVTQEWHYRSVWQPIGVTGAGAWQRALIPGRIRLRQRDGV